MIETIYTITAQGPVPAVIKEPRSTDALSRANEEYDDSKCYDHCTVDAELGTVIDCDREKEW